MCWLFVVQKCSIANRGNVVYDDIIKFNDTTPCSKKTKPMHYLSHLCQTETRFMKHVAAVHRLVPFSENNILQRSVATPFRCGGKFNDSFVANFLPSLSVKEF